MVQNVIMANLDKGKVFIGILFTVFFQNKKLLKKDSSKKNLSKTK